MKINKQGQGGVGHKPLQHVAGTGGGISRQYLSTAGAADDFFLSWIARFYRSGGKAVRAENMKLLRHRPVSLNIRAAALMVFSSAGISRPAPLTLSFSGNLIIQRVALHRAHARLPDNIHELCSWSGPALFQRRPHG